MWVSATPHSAARSVNVPSPLLINSMSGAPPAVRKKRSCQPSRLKSPAAIPPIAMFDNPAGNTCPAFSPTCAAASENESWATALALTPPRTTAQTRARVATEMCIDRSSSGSSEICAAQSRPAPKLKNQMCPETHTTETAPGAAQRKTANAPPPGPAQGTTQFVTSTLVPDMSTDKRYCHRASYRRVAGNQHMTFA